MATLKKLISLNLTDNEIEMLDSLVDEAKAKSFTPNKVNRSTVIRELLVNAVAEKRNQK